MRTHHLVILTELARPGHSVVPASHLLPAAWCQPAVMLTTTRSDQPPQRQANHHKVRPTATISGQPPQRQANHHNVRTTATTSGQQPQRQANHHNVRPTTTMSDQPPIVLQADPGRLNQYNLVLCPRKSRLGKIRVRFIVWNEDIGCCRIRKELNYWQHHTSSNLSVIYISDCCIGQSHIQGEIYCL